MCTGAMYLFRAIHNVCIVFATACSEPNCAEGYGVGEGSNGTVATACFYNSTSEEMESDAKCGLCRETEGFYHTTNKGAKCERTFVFCNLLHSIIYFFAAVLYLGQVHCLLMKYLLFVVMYIFKRFFLKASTLALFIICLVSYLRRIKHDKKLW